MPKISCASEPVMPFVYVIFSFVLVYIIFFTFIRSTGLLQPDECLEILQSIDEALAEATEPNYDPLGEDQARDEDLEATKKLNETTDPETEPGPEPGSEKAKRSIEGSVITRRRVTSHFS
mgnify:CR=1 FL=1